MVEVIGTDDKHVLTRTCKRCASILRFTLSETVMKRHTDLGGYTEYYDVVPCPKCGYEVEI